MELPKNIFQSSNKINFKSQFCFPEQHILLNWNLF